MGVLALQMGLVAGDSPQTQRQSQCRGKGGGVQSHFV